MYNLVFGMNPGAVLILAMIGRKREDFIRFRDCYVADGMVCVYTRNGGGNRDCYCDEEPDPHCTGCFMSGPVRDFPYYLRDEDDEFAYTYATIYFSFPPEYRAELEAMDSGNPWDPEGAWASAIESLSSGDLPKVEERLRPVVKALAEVFERAEAQAKKEIGG
jgi:hypothetical protein